MPPGEATRAAAELAARDPDVISLPGDSGVNSNPQGHCPLPDASAVRRRHLAETLTILVEWFPAAFVGLSEPRRPPLKIGIHLDLIERAPISVEEAREALRYYTNGFAYLRALVEGATRVDLAGEPAGAVTADEAAFAKLEIKAIYARLRARRKAEGSRDAPKLPPPKPPPPPSSWTAKPARPVVVEIIRRPRLGAMR